MCVSVGDLAAALVRAHSVHPDPPVKLASRHSSASGNLGLVALGNLLLLGESTRLALVRAGLCNDPLHDLEALSPGALAAKIRELALANASLPLEVVHQVIVGTDGARSLDYGGNCVEQIVWHSKRREVWLLVACAVVFDTSGGELEPL